MRLYSFLQWKILFERFECYSYPFFCTQTYLWGFEDLSSCIWKTFSCQKFSDEIALYEDGYIERQLERKKRFPLASEAYC